MATRRNAAKATAKAAPKTETAKAEVKTAAAEVKAETPVKAVVEAPAAKPVETTKKHQQSSCKEGRRRLA